MGWIENKWFPRWPGDYCSGFFEPPQGGSEPIWKLRDPDYEGTQDHRPMWVMVNGREISHYNIAMKRGGPDCKIEVYGKNPPWGIRFATHFCRTHVVWLHDEEHLLEHLKGNKSIYGQLVKEGIVKPLKPKEPEATPGAPSPPAPEPEIMIPEALAAELRTLLESVIAANEKFAGLWKQGKIGPLTGAAMKATAGKYEGKYVQKMLREIVDGRPV